MKQLLIGLSDELASRLEAVAPGRSRKRSEFVRRAIEKACWEVEEALTAEAYQRTPDAEEDAYFDPSAWEHLNRTRSRRPKK